MPQCRRSYCLPAAIVGFCGVATTLVSQGFAAVDPDPAMSEFREMVKTLIPLATSRETFADPKNHSVIAGQLKRFAVLSHHTQADKLKAADYQAPLRTLQALAEEVEDAFSHGRKERARASLKWAINLCVTCHVRLPRSVGLSGPIELPPIPNPFERGRLQLAVTDFEGASKSFLEVINTYPQTGMDWYTLVRSLNYLAALHVRLDQDPQRALKTFQKILQRNTLPAFVRDDVSAWITDLKIWNKSGVFKIENQSDSAVIKRAERILARSEPKSRLVADRADAIRYLRASGLLHQFLVERPKSSLAPKANYLLGLCYMNLDRDVFTGMDTAYLKSCIDGAPRTALARQCYTLLEENLYLGYSGAPGVSIPPGAEEDLERLRKAAGMDT